MKPFSYKISVIGAGAVGATLAQRLYESGLADVVLVDILKDVARGKAFDLTDAASIMRTEKSVIGTDDYGEIAGSDIVVITAGLPRKPGMSREDLIAKNAAIVKDVSARIAEKAPRAIVIVVTNPLDAMTYLAYKTTGFDKARVIGMAGVLDGSRFIALIADELKVRRSLVKTFVMGSHGDTMVPVISKTYVDGKPLASLLPADKIEKIVGRTRDRGAEIVSLLGTGSAYYSPSAASLRMIRAIMDDCGEVITASVYLEGEYGLNDICMGVPCRFDSRGAVEIVEFDLSEEERSEFSKSAKAVESSIASLRAERLAGRPSGKDGAG
ncbi:MAG: malate dehydrogenase [Candidatus Omnitrophota bacterium]